MSRTDALPGREAEAARLDRFLDEMSRSGADSTGHDLILIEGEPGIGKSALLDCAAELARARGFTVLESRCAQAESTWPLATLADLLDGLPASDRARFTDADRAALQDAQTRLATADGGSEAGRPADRVVADSVLNVVRAASTRAPIALVIDDLHWADAATVTVLRHVLRRTHAERVCLIATTQTGAMAGHFTALTADGLLRIALGGLTLGAMGEVLTSCLQVSIPRRLAVQLHEASGGNPRYALELARASLIPQGAQTALADVPVAGSLSSLVGAKCEGLPQRTREILLAAALLEDPTVDAVCRAVGHPETVWSDIDVADGDGIAHWVDGRLAFSHPLVRSVVREGATAGERRAMHRRLSVVVTGIEERARHLALAADGHDEAVAKLLDEATAHASRRGSRHDAAELAELAVSETPPHSPQLLPRMVTAARHLVAAMDLDKARTMLERVIAALPAGPTRAVALGHLAALLRGLGEPNSTWAQCVQRAIDESAGIPIVVAPLKVQLAVSALCARDIPSFELHVREAAALADDLGDTTLTAQVLSARAMVALIRGEDPSEPLQAALTLGASSGPPELRPHIMALTVLRHRDELDAARSHAEDAYRHVLDRGVDVELPTLLWNLIELEVWAGNWQRAEALLEHGWETARWSRSPLMHMMQRLSAATLHAHQGKLEVARTEADEALHLAERAGYPLFVSRALNVLGLIELSRDENERVDQLLGGVSRHATANAMGEPGLWRLVPDHIEALVRLGRIDEAEELLTPFERRADELDRLWARAAAARCRALIVLARGEDPGPVIDRLLAIHDELPMPFERARSLLVAGEICRRMRRRGQARDHVANASAIFAELGAASWLARAERESLRGGARAHAEDGLSMVERQVATLVASGLSNREIAAQAFMAVRTVEAHLTTIYRKLGVRSRTQLAAALDEPSSTLVGA